MSDSSVTVATLGPGSRIANYRIEREIGRGNMAVVYLATQLDLQRPVALKILTGRLAHDNDFVSRFLNEARTAAALSHPNIVQAFSAGAVAADLHYFAMEYIEGETLHDRIGRERQLKAADLLPIALDIAGALDYGWTRQRLVHGDIKPENIMLSIKGESKLADFGLAKVNEHSFVGDGLMLTPLYAAPEMIRGQAAAQDCRPDIYSFGATLYHALAGQPPFPGADPQEVMQRHLHEAPPPLRKFNPHLPERLAEFVTDQLLAKTAEERPQTWAAVIDHLDWFQSHKRPTVFFAAPAAAAGTPVPAPPPRPASRTPLIAVTAVMVLAAIGFLAWGALGKIRTDTAKRDALTAWNHIKTELAAESDLAAGLAILEQFDKTHGRFAPPGFRETLQRQQQLLATQLAPPSPAPAPPPVTPNPTPPAAPVAPPTPKPAPPAPTPAKPTPETAAPPPKPAVNTTERADRCSEFLAAATAQARTATANPGAWEPVIKLGRDWLAAYPDPSDEADQVRLFLDTVLPAAEELLPDLILLSPKLAGTPVTVKIHGTLPLDDISLRGISLRQKTDYGQVKLQVPWNEIDRTALLVTLGKASLGAPGQSLETSRPLLAFLLLTNRTDDLDAQLQALPESPEKRHWLILAASYRQAPQEALCLQAWQGALDAAHRHEFLAAGRSLLRARATPTAAANRHESEFDRLQRALAEFLPDARVPALILQAQKSVATDPRLAIFTLNLCRARYGALELPELPEITPLREQALDALASQLRQNNNSLPSLYSCPPLNPFLPSSQLPGDAAAILFRLKRQGATPPELKPLLTQLNAAALLDMGAWNEAGQLLRNRNWAPGENQYPPFVAGILFGRALLHHRFHDAGTAPATAMESLAKLRPRRGANDNEADGILQLRVRLQVDLALATRLWKLSPAPWPDSFLPRAASSRALATALGIAAWRLEAGLPSLTASQLSAAGDNSHLLQTANQLLDTPELADFPGATDAPADLRAHYCRLLLAALCRTPRQLPAERRHEPWDTLARYIPEYGFIAADTRFGVLLQQVALDLKADAPKAATSRVRDALGQHEPADLAFASRLLLLQAGIEFHRGFPGAARETLGLLAATTVASPAELAVAARHQNDTAPAPLSPDSKSPAASAAFWDAWLTWARLTAPASPQDDTTAANRLHTAAQCLAERHFALLLGATPATENKEAEAF